MARRAVRSNRARLLPGLQQRLDVASRGRGGADPDSLINDQPGTVTALEQERIAVWATKTMLAVGPTNLGGTPFASDDTYQWFGEHQAPLPGSVVWLGRYDGSGQWPISFHQHGIVIGPVDKPAPPTQEDPTNAFHAVFAIGHLVLCVFGHELPEGPIVSGGSNKQRVLIWPTNGDSIWWPPTATLSEGELRIESQRVPGGIAPPLPG